MECDKGKVDEYTLALLFLVMHDEKEHEAWWRFQIAPARLALLAWRAGIEK